MKEFTVGGKPRLQKAFAEVLGVSLYDQKFDPKYEYLLGVDYAIERRFINQTCRQRDTHFILPQEWGEAMSYAREFYGRDKEEPKEEKPPLPESFNAFLKSGIMFDLPMPVFNALKRLWYLRQAYWNAHDNWRPDWTDGEEVKHCIQYVEEKPQICDYWFTQHFLTLPTEEQAKHFLKHHKALIEQAKDLL